MFEKLNIIKHFNTNKFKTRIFLISQIRKYSSGSSEDGMKKILQSKFPNAKEIVVEDISGGCGAMYTVYVESIDFKGLSRVKQHQAITNALKEQIKTFHGIRIETKIPSS
nr:bolA-like protein 3 [Onthophagus taurus]